MGVGGGRRAFALDWPRRKTTVRCRREMHLDGQIQGAPIGNQRVGAFDENAEFFLIFSDLE